MFLKKNNSIKFFVALTALAMLLSACAGSTTAAAQTAPGNRSITVVGQGKAFGEPDQARVDIGIETFAESVDEATTKNQATMDALMTALTNQGIADEDVQTSNYSLWTEQIYGDEGPRGIAGYRVNNTVNVTIHDIDKMGAVLEAVIEAGANSIYGVSFMVADPAALEAEARAKAMEDARARAEELARLGTVELGDVMMISEVLGSPQPFFGRGGGDAISSQEAAAPGISPGQLSFQVQVQVTFGIK